MSEAWRDIAFLIFCVIVLLLPWQPDDGKREEGETMGNTIIAGSALALYAAGLVREYIKSGIYEMNGNDRSPEIDRIESAFGVKGVSYCAMSQAWCYAKALAQLKDIPVTEENCVSVVRSLLPELQQHYFRPDPSCGVIMDDAMSRGTWIHRTPGADGHFLEKLQPGDLPIFEWRPGDRHVGMYLEPPFTTGEFNTVAPGGTRKGAYIRDRMPYIGFVLGAVSINR
jgi:hypothetical protein